MWDHVFAGKCEIKLLAEKSENPLLAKNCNEWEKERKEREIGVSNSIDNNEYI